MGKTRNKIGAQESLDFIIANMATKGDVRDIIQEEVPKILREELKDIRAELKDIRIRLTVLEESSKSHSGFSKEIDHVLRRVAAIEKHLGIKSKAAA